jgi:hypothetical protein
MTMEKRKTKILCLAIAAFVMQWISQFINWEVVADISRLLDVVFFLIVIFSLIREMATAKVVTLATLGYGDMVPLKPYSRSLATLITISGQLYVATIIGILIGKFASKDKTHHKHD